MRFRESCSISVILFFFLQDNLVLSKHVEVMRRRGPSDAENAEIRKDDHEQNIFRDIWETEALLAEREAERLLSGNLFNRQSLPPTRHPTPRPITPAPQPKPPTTLPPVIPPTTQSPTFDSSCLNGRTRQQYLFDQLSLITNPSLLTNPSTPQGKAFIFMNNDPLNPNVCTYPTIDQRYGLATFYYATNGQSWENRENWLSSTGECNWFGVNCNNSVLASNLELPDNKLRGSIPEEISTLYGMTQMLLPSNSITSTIPLGIANQTLLTSLDLEMNGLTGPPVPAQILVLPNIRQLFLSSNAFENERLPDDINLMEKLTDLWLANNNMVGPIPSTIGELTLLESLLLYNNKFTGSLPSEMGLLTAMTDLRLSQNVFGGELPEELYNMIRLQVLHLNQNFFEGSISTNLGSLNSLVDIRFDNTFFNGSLPNSIGQLTNLQTGSFSRTKLEGLIPDVFANLNALQFLDLSVCAFDGPIPSSLFEADSLRILYLNENRMTGAIPPNYADPLNLEELFLNNNQFIGTVPAISLGQLESLSAFTLERNSFSGSMPASVCRLRNEALDDLFADCGGPQPEIECAFPACCNRCFQD